MADTNGKPAMHLGRNMYREVESEDELAALLATGGVVRRYAFQGIDFSPYSYSTCSYEDCLFMGCVFNKSMREQIGDSCLIFSRIGMPYSAFRNRLYSAESLYDKYRRGYPESYDNCYDNIVYQHYLSTGKTATDIKETLARALHDRAISDALHDFLSNYEEKQIVGIMGGHGLLRTDRAYRQVACISKKLTENGFVMISGGGPGAMEATHLGAWMAGRSIGELDSAIDILSKAPSYKDRLWLDTAFDVIGRFPQNRYKSLGVPTWLYGHEPATPFATHIAKYFENAIREDGILTIAMGGIIYSPGSAGTMQEIFQDAVQNHYLSFGYASPMVFLDKNYWTEEMPVYPLLEHLMQTGKYRNLILSISDDEEEIVGELMRFKNK